MNPVFRRTIPLIACVVLALSGAMPASASGTARVVRSDGTREVYPGVELRLVKGEGLAITSADGKGVLDVKSSACYFDGVLRRCLITGVGFTQGGSTKPLTLTTGAIYVNSTTAKQNVPGTAAYMPPDSVYVAITTANGTSITVAGSIDKGAK